MMASSEYERFVASMKIGYEQWHDCTGYDLDALKALGAEERARAEAVLIDHLKNEADWRDVEALEALGSWDAIRGACQHSKREVRMYAVRLVGDERQKEDEIVRGLLSREFSAVSRALDMAEDCRTERVKEALMHCARGGSPEAKVNAAAMLLYICGEAAAPFDWEQRPFLLRFRSDDAREVQAAIEELQRRTTGK